MPFEAHCWSWRLADLIETKWAGTPRGSLIEIGASSTPTALSSICEKDGIDPADADPLLTSDEVC